MAQNELPAKSAFILHTNEEIHELVASLLTRRMKQYKRRFGFNHDDVLIWQACDIKYPLAKIAAKLSTE